MRIYCFHSRTCPMSVAQTLDTNKYKLLMKIAIEDLDIFKGKNTFCFKNSIKSKLKFPL